MVTNTKICTSLLAPQGIAKRCQGDPCSFFSTTVGGWKIPKPSTATTNNNKKQSPVVETFSFRHPYTQEPVQILLQQRFTVAPGTATANTGDQTGTWVWPTTHVLLDYFLQQQQQHDNEEDYLQQWFMHPTTSTSSSRRTINILELGSGCGLLGMALAAMAGPHQVHVTLSDHAGNIGWLQQNLALNRSRPMMQQRQVEARTLSWGKYKDNVTLLQQEQQQQPIDIILGSDLIYERTNHEALVETLIGLKDTNLIQFEKSPTILLAYPHREKSTEDHFFQLLLADGSFRDVEKKQLDKNVILATVT